MPTVVRISRVGRIFHQHAGVPQADGWHWATDRHFSLHRREDIDAHHPTSWLRSLIYAPSRFGTTLATAEEIEQYHQNLQGTVTHVPTPRSPVVRRTRSPRYSYYRPINTTYDYAATIPDPPPPATTPVYTAADQRRFGVEIECIGPKRILVESIRSKGINIRDESASYSTNTHTTRSYWKIVPDGSLVYHDGTPGFQTMEIVSPILMEDEGFNSLKLVCDSLSEVHAIVNHTCGLHVHHDAMDFDLGTFKNLGQNYYAAQIAIDQVVASSRRSVSDHQYCHPFTESDLHIIQEAPRIRTLTGFQRYKALNFQAYTRHHTVEFRQHQGTTDYAKISAWVRLGQYLVWTSKSGMLLPIPTESLTFMLSFIEIPETDKEYLLARSRTLNGTR